MSNQNHSNSTNYQYTNDNNKNDNNNHHHKTNPYHRHYTTRNNNNFKDISFSTRPIGSRFGLEYLNQKRDRLKSSETNFNQYTQSKLSIHTNPNDGKSINHGNQFTRETSPYEDPYFPSPNSAIPISEMCHLLKDHLGQYLDKQVTNEILNLNQKIKFKQEDYDNRMKFILKIQNIFTSEFPEEQVAVHLFGSTLSGLYTRSSDIDLCLSTKTKSSPLSNVKLIAETLKKHGMIKIYTISKAKVPICKFFDPELNLACDINVNSLLGVQNSLLLKTYSEIDVRAKSLLMTIKYWAKRRSLADASKGGTLSSYTWCLMVINFLQTRSPPILPCLHDIYLEEQNRKRENHEEIDPPIIVDKLDCSFYRNTSLLSDFGSKNTESVGELLYQFFKFYACEFDYNHSVISVRHGKLLSKIEKGWHEDVETYYRYFCVEEPFFTKRNLGNSVDGVTVEGLQREFFRAAQILCEDKDQRDSHRKGKLKRRLVDVCLKYFFSRPSRSDSPCSYRRSASNGPKSPSYPIGIQTRSASRSLSRVGSPTPVTDTDFYDSSDDNGTNLKAKEIQDSDVTSPYDKQILSPPPSSGTSAPKPLHTELKQNHQQKWKTKKKFTADNKLWALQSNKFSDSYPQLTSDSPSEQTPNILMTPHNANTAHTSFRDLPSTSSSVMNYPPNEEQLVGCKTNIKQDLSSFRAQDEEHRPKHVLKTGILDSDSAKQHASISNHQHTSNISSGNDPLSQMECKMKKLDLKTNY